MSESRVPESFVLAELGTEAYVMHAEKNVIIETSTCSYIGTVVGFFGDCVVLRHAITVHNRAAGDYLLQLAATAEREGAAVTKVPVRASRWGRDGVSVRTPFWGWDGAPFSVEYLSAEEISSLHEWPYPPVVFVDEHGNPWRL